ncbi:secreted protein containing SmpA/OmlA domain protein [Candidatus Magnetomorum sp. HK-1]|nr:secreted protein containing SmpA/OmlA domain protein [Candidatus Magnetomorum sp. HK-1]
MNNITYRESLLIKIKWKNNIITLLLLAILIFTNGCVSSYGNNRITDQSVLSQIKKGVSNKEDVKRLIGSPQSVSFIGDDEQWFYYFSKSKVRSTTFIPIIGVLFGGADMQSNNTTVLFDSKGIVKKVGSGNSVGGGGGIQDNL